MRIISGQARGRRLKVPKTDVRPSTDRLREALFSILAGRVEEAVVCDLFAGTGSLALESLSRGAKSAVLVEGNRAVSRVTQGNVDLCQLPARVVVSDVFAFLKRDAGRYDLIFADPPYTKNFSEVDLAGKLMTDPCLSQRLADDGLLVLEVFKEARVVEAKGWKLVDDRSYGVCRLLFYEKVSGKEVSA